MRPLRCRPSFWRQALWRQTLPELAGASSGRRGRPPTSEATPLPRPARRGAPTAPPSPYPWREGSRLTDQARIGSPTSIALSLANSLHRAPFASQRACRWGVEVSSRRDLKVAEISPLSAHKLGSPKRSDSCVGRHHRQIQRPCQRLAPPRPPPREYKLPRWRHPSGCEPPFKAHEP